MMMIVSKIHATWDFSRFATHLEQIQQKHNDFFANIKGSASTAILFRNETVGEIFAGIAQGNNQKPNRDTKYRIASVTKTFVSAAMMVLRDEGLIDLDQSACDFVPEFCKFPNPDGLISNFTFRQLSSYMSGLPREAPCILTECDFTNSQIMDRIKENGLFLVRDGDHFPIYSNLGYSFLGHALESAAKINFEQVIQSRILDKLGMKNSGFVTKDNLNSIVLAEGYHESERIYTNNKTISWSQPAAGMFSTIGDLTLYVKSLMNAFANYGNKMDTSIMNRQSLREFLNAQHVLTHGSAAVGLSWEMVHYPFLGGWAIMKSGLIGGYNAQVVMIPHCEMAVITLLSRDDGAQSLALQSASIIASAMKDYLTELREQEIAGTNYASLVSQYKQSSTGNIVSLELGNVTNSNTQKLLKIRNPTSSISSSFNLIPSKDNEFIIQTYDIPTRIQYEKGLGGSRVITRNDIANITSPDFDLFATISVSNRRNLERDVVLPNVCNHIPKEVSILSPFTDSNIAVALKSLKDSVAAFATRTGSNTTLQVNYRGLISGFASGNQNVFNIGTLTQLFTTTSVLIAKEKGFIKSLDEPIAKYLPQVVYQENLPFGNSMTIRQLMNHASGLPIIAPCDDSTSCALNWDQYIAKSTSEQHLIQPSSTLRTFSTAGYVILGQLIASSSGVSYQKFITDNIFTPLQMSDSSFKSSSVLASNSEISSTVSDISKLLTCISGINRECSIIKRESARLLHLRNLLSDDKSMSMSLGSFEHEFSNGIWFASKYGSIKGSSSYIAMNDDIDLSVVVLTNSEESIGKYLVSNQSVIPNLFKTFTTALQKEPSFLKSKVSPNVEFIQDMKGVYKVFDQFLLFTQYLQIDYNDQLGIITFAFVESATPAPSSAPPTFVLEMLAPNIFKVKTLSTLSCMGNVLTGVEGALVKFKLSNGKIQSFTMPSLNYGSDFEKIITPTPAAPSAKVSHAFNNAVSLNILFLYSIMIAFLLVNF